MEFHLKIEKHYKADKDVNVEMRCKHASARSPAVEGTGRPDACSQLNVLLSLTPHTYARSLKFFCKNVIFAASINQCFSADGVFDLDLR